MVGWHHRLSGRKFDRSPETAEDTGTRVPQSAESQGAGHDVATGQQQQTQNVTLKILHSKKVFLCGHRQDLFL